MQGTGEKIHGQVVFDAVNTSGRNARFLLPYSTSDESI
nr:MAG TPA: hypothetical protein [Caudoviricetes sp.]